MGDDSALRGRRVVITAGGTREAIDPVRYVGNRSSGKMGNALASSAVARGAQVVLITTVAASEAAGIEVVRVESAAEMHAAVLAALRPDSVLVMAAAVADYRPATVATEKIKKTGEPLELTLLPTVDILADLANNPGRASWLVVGFAAETSDALRRGQEKVAAKRLDLCVINDVSQPGIGMGADDNAVTIVDAGGVIAEVGRAAKSEVARRILDVVERRLGA